MTCFDPGKRIVVGQAMKKSWFEGILSGCPGLSRGEADVEFIDRRAVYSAMSDSSNLSLRSLAEVECKVGQEPRV